jgi:hypothetical protein
MQEDRGGLGLLERRPFAEHGDARVRIVAYWTRSQWSTGFRSAGVSASTANSDARMAAHQAFAFLMRSPWVKGPDRATGSW